tara:strand:- start:86 stop:280 length:195 start_codon:yes stop_codon:yes gene_type:complete
MFIKSISDLLLSWLGYNTEEEEQPITNEKITEKEEKEGEEEDEGPIGLPLESDDEETDEEDKKE